MPHILEHYTKPFIYWCVCLKKRRRRRKNADTERVLNHPSESLKENCSERHAGEGREREEEEGGRKVGSGQGDFFSNAGMLATCCFSLSLHRSISPVVRWGGRRRCTLWILTWEKALIPLYIFLSFLFPATQLFLVPHSWPPTLCSSPLCPSHSNNPKLVFAWYTVKICTASYSVHHQKGTAFQIINK